MRTMPSSCANTTSGKSALETPTFTVFLFSKSSILYRLNQHVYSKFRCFCPPETSAFDFPLTAAPYALSPSPSVLLRCPGSSCRIRLR
jgi:hypothetical protein